MKSVTKSRIARQPGEASKGGSFPQDILARLMGALNRPRVFWKRRSGFFGKYCTENAGDDSYPPSAEGIPTHNEGILEPKQSPLQ